jgi:Flp pilus assembly protein CpaB
MMKRDTVILCAAVACGAVAFALSARSLESSRSAQRYVAAAKALHKGQTVKESDVTMSRPMKNVEPDSSFLQLHDVIGREAVEDVPAGNLIRRAQVAYVPAVTTATPELNGIPEGLRALVVPASGFEGLSDLVASGAYVDIMGEVPDAEDRPVMETIIRGARVLSVTRSKDGEIKSVTLALSPLGAELVTRATSKAKIRLLVRPDAVQREMIQSSGFGLTEIIRGVDKEKRIIRTGGRRGI